MEIVEVLESSDGSFIALTYTSSKICFLNLNNYIL